MLELVEGVGHGAARAQGDFAERPNDRDRGRLVAAGPSDFLLGNLGFAGHPHPFLFSKDKANLTAGQVEVNPEPNRSAPHERGYGAYGLEFTGLSHVVDLLVPGPSDRSWPPIRVLRELGDADERPDYADLRRADMGLLGGERALLDREERSATFLLKSVEDDGRIVHPLLTAAGVIFAWWHGREALHAGAFVTSQGAWALLGEQGAGKSSMLASLALAGHPILTDDLLIVNGEYALAGPRCLDLRENGLGPSGLEGMTEPVRGSERHRLRLGPVDPEVPLRGWIFLSWGSELVLRPMSPTERLEQLSAQRNVQGIRPERLLQLARLPGWELTRPFEGNSFEPAVHQVLELAGD
jgi:hypothetical protein